MREFWAHSDPIQLLASHLRNVAVIAACLATSAAPEEPALHAMVHLAGLLHDYGKYTDCFQERIRGGAKRCPHSIHGAIAVRQFRLPGVANSRDWAMPVVRAIAAHHAGLMDDADLLLSTNVGNALTTNPARRAPDPDGYAATAKKIRGWATQDLPEIEAALKMTAPLPASGIAQDLLTRILLSCLVDADLLDSAGRRPVQASLDATARLDQLILHLDTLRKDAKKRGGSEAVYEVRQQVQQLCHDGAQGDARLLSLTVSTGGGKPSMTNLQWKTFDTAGESQPNSTVADRFYNLVMNSPAVGMDKVFSLGRKHIAKLRKLKDLGASAAFGIEQQIGQLELKLGGDIPPRFGMHDKARFALGFYHQKAYRPKNGASEEESTHTDFTPEKESAQ